MGFPPQGSGGINRVKLSEGTLTADGTEQTVLDYTPTSIMKVYGWFDLNELEADDACKLRSYLDTVMHGEEDYADALDRPRIYVVGRIIEKGVNYVITFEQTLGVMRDYPYIFFKEF